MSIEIPGRTRQGQRTSSVPLDQIIGTVHRLIPSVEEAPSGFSFRGRLGTTHLHVRPVDHQFQDRSRITEVVTIKTDLTGFPIPSENAEVNVAALNMNSAMSALMVVRRGQSTVLVSRLSAFEGDHQAWDLYTPMLAFTAVFQSEFFCQTIARTHLSRDRTDPEVLPEANSASPWDTPDFDVAQELLDRVGVLAFSDATGLTAELPFDPGAVSQMERFFGSRSGEGGRTSLLKLTTRERHPALGNGLLCRLVLPVSFGEKQLARAACRLNLLELTAIDAPPFFGAWTVDPELCSVTFVTFVPNVLYRPGVVANLTSWMMARAQRAKRWTEVDTALAALARQGRPTGA